ISAQTDKHYCIKELKLLNYVSDCIFRAQQNTTFAQVKKPLVLLLPLPKLLTKYIQVNTILTQEKHIIERMKLGILSLSIILILIGVCQLSVHLNIRLIIP